MSTPGPAEPDTDPPGDGAPATTAMAAEDTPTDTPTTRESRSSTDPADAEVAEPGHAETAESGGPAGTATAERASALDFLPSPLFVLLLGITGIAAWLAATRAEVRWTGDASVAYTPIVLIVAGWIVCLAVHEYAHAMVAYRFGHRALRGTAYLRLNPFGFRHLFAGVVMPVAFVFLGALGMTGPALYLEGAAVPGRVRRTLVALAGPLANLLVAVALGIAVTALVPAGSVTNNWALGGLMFLCYLNASAALVNLLPIPGMDGFAALAPYLPERVARHAHASGLFGTIAVFAVLWFPMVNPAFLDLMYAVFGLVGLPQLDIGHGSFMVQPW